MLVKVYRITDKGNTKSKLLNASKQNCFNNFISEFGQENLFVFADNCNRDTIDFLTKFKVPIFESSLGSSGSFKKALDFIVYNFKDEDKVYLIEDDYLHLLDSKKKLLEGLQIADYVTLYDHPDKYGLFNDNPFIHSGGEISNIFVTKSLHWKTTNSTPLSFATSVKVLKEDLGIFQRFCSRKGTWSFGIFSTLTKQPILPMIRAKKYYFATLLRCFYLFIPRKKRTLLSPIPSCATHTEVKYLAPIVKWDDL